MPRINVEIVDGTIICPDKRLKRWHGEDVKLKWRMRTDGYEITNIEFDGQADDQFYNFRTDRQHYRCRDENTRRNVGGYKYTITVRSGSGEELCLDPMIRNRPR